MQEYVVGQCGEIPQQPLLYWLQEGPCWGAGAVVTREQAGLAPWI